MLHHLDLNVSDLERSQRFYRALLPLFGYEPGESGQGWTIWRCEGFYLTLVQVEEPYQARGYHRKAVGVNHLAFPAPSREAVDRLYRWLVEQGASVLYGGPLEMGSAKSPNYAVFFEDPDRLKLEYVFRTPMLDPRKIGFRRLTLEDLPLLHRWLNHTPSVGEWYAHGEDTPYDKIVAKYGERITGQTPTSSFAILYGASPIGYIQQYLWRDYDDLARRHGLQEEAAGIDLFIGDEAYLHRGLGQHVLRAFLQAVVFANPDVESCVIIVEERNASALRAYAKAGFAQVKYLPDEPGEPGPSWLLRVARDEIVR